MNRADRLSKMAARLLLLPSMLVFFSISFRHVFHPAQTALSQGMVLTTPLGMTAFRAGLGGFPLACAICLLVCLCSRGRVLAGLLFAEFVVCTVLCVRIGGMLADDSFLPSLRLVISEIVLAAITATGILLELRERGRSQLAE